MTVFSDIKYLLSNLFTVCFEEGISGCVQHFIAQPAWFCVLFLLTIFFMVVLVFRIINYFFGDVDGDY